MRDARGIPELVSGLRCPTCLGRIDDVEGQPSCAACGQRFAVRDHGRGLDLRPNEPFEVSASIVVGGSGPEPGSLGTDVLAMNPSPEITAPAGALPRHLTPEQVSWIPGPSRPGALVLDLGCGSGQNEALLEAAGYQYVGADYGNEDASILADAHCLPFADDLFDLVISIAVLEHLEHPARAMAEVRRVLAPGRALVGTVAFLEPEHARSYFHHTALGVVATMQAAGLNTEVLGAVPNHSVLDQGSKVLFTGVPTVARRIVVAPIRWFHRACWAVARRTRRGDYSEGRRITATAGAWAFVARKPPAAPRSE